MFCLYTHQFTWCLHSYLEFLILASFYFVKRIVEFSCAWSYLYVSSSLSRRFTRFVLPRLLFNFQGPSPATASRDSLTIISHLTPPCQYLFQKFFQEVLFFWCDSDFLGREWYYSTHGSLCQGLFERKFIHIFSLLIISLFYSNIHSARARAGNSRVKSVQIKNLHPSPLQFNKIMI